MLNSSKTRNVQFRCLNSFLDSKKKLILRQLEIYKYTKLFLENHKLCRTLKYFRTLKGSTAQIKFQLLNIKNFGLMNDYHFEER